MKLKIVLIILIAFLLSLNTNAQIAEVKTLFFGFTMAEFPYVYSDKVTVTKVSGDTTWFNSSVNNPSGKGYYFRAGQKVFRVPSNSNPVLFYDYNLVKGDTFLSRIGAVPDTFIVDSVYTRIMNKHSFKAWHLTLSGLKLGSKVKLEWVEGLGDLRTGWDYKCYRYIDWGWEIKGMCLNDSVIYWDSAYNYFKDRNPSPSCSFDSISKRLIVPKLTSGNTLLIYPNPVAGILTVDTKVAGSARIIDLTGKVCLDEVLLKEGIQTFDVSILETGIYTIAFQFGNEVLFKKLCVLGR